MHRIYESPLPRVGSNAHTPENPTNANSITRFGEIHQFIIHAHLDAVWSLASRYLVWCLLDLPNLAVGKVGAVVDQGEGLLLGSANVARTDWWLSDFSARDGECGCKFDSERRQFGGPVGEGRCVGGDHLGRLVCRCLDGGVSFFSLCFER